MALSADDLRKLSVASDPTGGKGFALPLPGYQPLMLAALGSRKIVFGTVNVTWPGGSARSNDITVAHGLGATPVVVVATNNGNSGLTAFPTWATTAFGASTFVLTCWTVDEQLPANTASSAMSWLAIG